MLHIAQHLVLVHAGAHRQAQRPHDGAGALDQLLVLDHGQHTQRHALAMIQAVGAAAPDALHRLDAVADGVAEVEAGPHAGLPLVLLHHPLFHL